MQNFQHQIVTSNTLQGPSFSCVGANSSITPESFLYNMTNYGNSYVQRPPGESHGNINGLNNFDLIFNNGVQFHNQIQSNFLNGCNLMPLTNPDLYSQNSQLNIGIPSNSTMTFQKLAIAKSNQTLINKPNDLSMSNEPKSISNHSSPAEDSEVEYDNKNRPLIYQCKECTRKFSMNSRLNQHMRCHTGQRPYICTQCNFAFTQKSYLVRHAAVHKDERPFTCEKCSKTYKHYGSLANHRKTHKNDKNTSMESNYQTEIKSENSVYDETNCHSNQTVDPCPTDLLIDNNNNINNKMTDSSIVSYPEVPSTFNNLVNNHWNLMNRSSTEPVTNPYMFLNNQTN